MLAKHVAFFSIGTNDLTQYIMAADRLHPAVARLNDVTNPAVMTAIGMTAKARCEAGIMVGMCGEAAGRADLIAQFIRMGLTELSMSPSSIQRAKKAIAELSKFCLFKAVLPERIRDKVKGFGEADVYPSDDAEAPWIWPEFTRQDNSKSTKLALGQVGNQKGE